jgi:Tfp pilus assembly protein PilF/2-polyprenyl-3-methyl-5-hydroxy-6-metoxy-1,4-benzoquinol methylase
MTTSADALIAAVRHHQAGELAEADRLYTQVLAAEPEHVHALQLRGALAHSAGRNEDAVELISRAIALDGSVPDSHYNIALALWALNRRPEAIRHWARAIALNPNFAPARLNLGNALREEGRFDDSIAQLRAAVQLQPQSPLIHNNLGLSLAKAGRDAEAMPHYARAITLQPLLIDAYLNLAMSHVSRGQIGHAIAVVTRSIEARETPANRDLLARLVSGFLLDRDNEPLRRMLTRALVEGWGAPASFSPTAIALIRHSPVRPLIDCAAEAWPARLAATELGRQELVALRDPLLRALIQSTVVHDPALEKFLAACRFTLLEIAEGTPTREIEDELLDTACALARQCFINEYVYAAGDDEEARARRLRDRLGDALTAGAAVPALWVTTVAAYFPLLELGAADALLARSWPAPIAALLDQQVRAPREEAALRAAIPQLTPIEDDVSRAVQTQYEANPYPRWITAGTLRQYPRIDAYLRDMFPAAKFRPLGKSGLDILIAGCGTGQHAILTTQQFEGARTLAVDLSRASLAYAMAKTNKLGLDIEYAQADIMRLGALQRRFDLIESAGVLHHLADPYAGWRVLLSLLRPGGFMRIALYSEVARWGVVAARREIAERGYGASAAEIRRFRGELMQRSDSAAQNVMRMIDFYSTSECRDFLFHTQEHRMTLPAIKRFLAEQNLGLVSMEVASLTARQYATHFPNDPAMTNLDNWDEFERNNPHTFETMYRFWVQAPAS